MGKQLKPLSSYNDLALKVVFDPVVTTVEIVLRLTFGVRL